MGTQSTELSYEIVPLHNCKLISILDTSNYFDSDNVEGLVLQILPPWQDEAVELNYNQSAITILNSNSLKLTKVTKNADLQELPDGLYVGKISICPYDVFWFEKKWYRTCQLECKYNKAILELDLNSCTNCYSKEKIENLHLAQLYIQGIHANVGNCNYKAASNLYTIANKLLDNILECDC